MLHAWNEGMASLRSLDSSVEFKGLSDAIEAAGFSNAWPPESQQKTIGRSELLAKPRKRKGKKAGGAAPRGKRVRAASKSRR
jgi:serine/threonine-protein kinase HipA